MIDRPALLDDLQSLLKELRDDIRERIGAQPELDARLREEHRAAREADRTGEVYEEWREEPITQAAVAWILGCVFVRFLEDNGLVDTPRLSGPGERLAMARDNHTLFFQKHPSETDREYLLDVFSEVGQLPAAKELFDRAHNPLWSLPVSGDGARKLLELWQQIDPATGALVHDFTDPDWGTRFLGDLYQDLSEDARKRYALLQTPEFVEEFILDRTLDPAIDTFGYKEVRLIDPTCGSGHFLLGTFRRLFDLHLKHEPGTNVRELAQRALEGVWGVDINPFAVAIARFRLLVAALKASGVGRLKDAPGFAIHLAVGDSLLHGPRYAAIAGVQRTLDPADDPLRHVYASEDRDALRAVLGQRYQAVVGNPPYITVKDKALNEAYRQKYGSCHMKYSLAVPFMERFFELALPSPSEGGSQPTPEESAAPPAGFVGMITSNSFMKREFGKKLIEGFIPRWDLTHVLDTSGAYIPGHGTPTVILFGRNRLPVSATVRAVMGIRGEPTTPEDPSRGLVWAAMVAQIDQPGSSSEWVSVSDTRRDAFQSHPWNIGGGGAAELKDRIDAAADCRLGDQATSIGFASFPGLDDPFVLDRQTLVRRGVDPTFIRLYAVGEVVRDWCIIEDECVLAPYDRDFALVPLEPTARWVKHLWPFRTSLGSVRGFGGETRGDSGEPWWAWYRWVVSKYRVQLSIAFSNVATHNHFVLERGRFLFNAHAPVIKLPAGASEGDHLALLGLLNSSTGCFWMKQVLHSKGAQGINEGGKTELWERFFEFDGTKLRAFPIPGSKVTRGRTTPASEDDQRGRRSRLAADGTRDVTSALLEATGRFRDALPGASAARAIPSAEALAVAKSSSSRSFRECVAIQEELDWECYWLYGLLDEKLGVPVDGIPAIGLGERAFEIVMARHSAAGELATNWYRRHASTPITEIPQHWPEDYRRLVEQRIEAIESDPNIRLIEQPEHKRRWNTEPWDVQQERTLRLWLLDRLESPGYWPQVEPQSCARLADRAHGDREFMQVAEILRDRADFDVTALVVELVEAEAVPFLPVLRYRETGLRKRALWERTWALQRREDAGEQVGTIEAPPKYTSADFVKGDYWRLRGKLDVPKERFISYPGCGRAADPTLLVGWAGWDHLEQAKALAGHYVAMKDTEGWAKERLVPLLAGLLEVLPWLEQWHNAPDPAYGMGLGEYFRRFVDEEARSLDLTLDAIRAWRPETGTRGKARKR